MWTKKKVLFFHVNLDKIWNLSSPLKFADVHISIPVWFPNAADSWFSLSRLQSGKDVAISVLCEAHSIKVRSSCKVAVGEKLSEI